jgi:type II secretory pathway pseudopilin PulG
MRIIRPARTLVEVLVAVSILAVLFGLAMVAVNRVREAARRTVCVSHLRQLALAVHTYYDSHQAFPPYATRTPQAQVFGGWWIYLMPFTEEANFHDELVHDTQPVVSDGGKQVVLAPVQQEKYRKQQFRLLTCPSDPSAHHKTGWVGTSNYLANWYVLGNGVHGCFAQETRHFKDIPDGLSNTVLFAEGYSHCGKMVRPALTVCCSHNFGITPDYLPSDADRYQPHDYTMFQVQPPVHGKDGCDYWRTQTGHATMPVALLDGSTRLLQPEISPVLWKQILKPNDGGVLED